MMPLDRNLCKRSGRKEATETGDNPMWWRSGCQVVDFSSEVGDIGFGRQVGTGRRDQDFTGALRTAKLVDVVVQPGLQRSVFARIQALFDRRVFPGSGKQ